MALNEGIRQQFRTRLAQLLRADFAAESKNRYFIFLGKPKPWDVEGFPDAATDSNAILFDAHRSMIGMKAVRPDDVYLLIPRLDWDDSVVYDEYDPDENIWSSDFYVLTDENNVYKCISNNDGSESVTQPTGTSPYIFTTETDEYKWKFMFKVSEDSMRFMTEEFIPLALAPTATTDETLPQFTTESYAVDGAIDQYEITLGTAVYDRVTVDPFLVGNPNDGQCIDPATGEELLPSAVNVAGSHFIKLNSGMESVDPNAGFSNYYLNYAVYVSGGRGKEVGQIFRVKGYHGPSKTALVYPAIEFDLYQQESVDGGSTILPPSQYQILPFIEISGDGSGASARCVMDSSKTVQEVRALKRGVGYTVADVAIDTPETSGTAPTIAAKVGPKGGHGSNAIDELGAADLMVVLNTEGNEDENISTGNDYRQFGLVRNPILNDDTGRIAGSEVDRITTMRIANPYFLDATYQFVVDPTFVVGEYVIGSESFAVGKVKGWISTPGNSYGLLYVTPVSGSFLPPSNGEYSRIVFGSTGYGTFAVGDSVHQAASEENNFGITAQGVVISWTPESTYAAELVLKVTQGSFAATGADIATSDIAYPTTSVLAVEKAGGELLKQFAISNGEVEFDSYARADGVKTPPLTTQEIGRIVEYDPSKVVDETNVAYRQTWRLLLGGLSGGTFTSSSFAADKWISQTDENTEISTTATIVEWKIASSGATGEMFVNDVQGVLSARANGVGGNFDYEDGISASLSGVTILTIEEPETIVGSGDILYVSNVRAIDRSVEQAEEFRIRIGF